MSGLPAPFGPAALTRCCRLMHADRPVAEITQGRVRPLLPARLPLHFDHGHSFEAWLSSRTMAQSRRAARPLRDLLGLADGREAVLSVRALTVTDHYWLSAPEETLIWEDVRYRSDHLARTALSGRPNRDRISDIAGFCPQLTVPGSSEKAWRREGSYWFLYKRGNVQERYAELLTYALGKALGFSMVRYVSARSCVKCRDFTKGVFDFEPAAALVGDQADEWLGLHALRVLHPGLSRPYLDLRYLDALVHNPDRTPYDYGVLRDWQSGEILGMAPNFDNNRALFSCGAAGKPGDMEPIDRFLRLCADFGGHYPPPRALTEAALRRLAGAVLPENRIDRAPVVPFLLARQKRLQAGLREQARR